MSIMVLPSVLLWLLVLSNGAVYFQSETEVAVFCLFNLSVMSNESSSLNVEITTPSTFFNTSSKSLNISPDSPGFITGYFISAGSNEFDYTLNDNSIANAIIISKDISIKDTFDYGENITIGDLLTYFVFIDNELVSDLDFEYSLSLLDSSKMASTNINGVLKNSSSSNSTTFDQFRIIRKGNYYLLTNILIKDKNSNQYKFPFESSSFSITSSITSMQLKCSPQPEQFIDESCSLDVFGNNNVSYLDGFSVSLNTSDGSTLGNWINILDVKSSSTDLKFYYTSFGVLNLEVSVSSTDKQIFTLHKSIDVQASNFLISDLKVKFIQDITSETSFNIELTIKSASGSKINFERLANPDIGLEICNNTSEYSGKKLKINEKIYENSFTFKLTSNPFTLENLKILSSGNFYFIFSTSSIYIPPKKSNNIKVINKVTKIIFLTPSPSNFFDFNIEFELYGDDDLLFIGDSVLKISENSNLGLIGELNYKTTNTGKITSSPLYFLGSGEAELKFDIDSFSSSTNFTVYQSKIILTIEDSVISN